MRRQQPRDCRLVSLLIDELDENGYVPTRRDDILTFLPPELVVDPDELYAALRLYQSFDPPGVGARSLAECLCLQLNHLQTLAATEALPHDVLALDRRISVDNLFFLATDNLNRLRDALHCDHDLWLSAPAFCVHL